MKIRTGFVSNSSSSCFICNAKMKLSDVEEICFRIFELLRFIENAKSKSRKHLYFGKTYTEMFEPPIIASPTDGTYYVNLVCEYRPSYTKEQLYGKILITSAEDNSIPSEVFELIEQTFDAERIHLGWYMAEKNLVPRDYLEGLLAGIRLYAWADKDGTSYVGNGICTLNEATKKIYDKYSSIEGDNDLFE